jgi:XTP/dITP diphosphohydrolase
MKIVFATANRHKLEEVAAILGDRFELVTPADMGIAEDIPETGNTLAANALQKAHYIYDRTETDCFADDTGLEVTALGGAPGVHSARYAGEGHDFEANNRLLLQNLSEVADRSARFRTVVALILGGAEYLFEGEVRGRIIDDYRGGGGFGYDPIFVPDGYNETFAEMTAEEKNSISHRARAVEKLATFLKTKKI